MEDSLAEMSEMGGGLEEVGRPGWREQLAPLQEDRLLIPNCKYLENTFGQSRLTEKISDRY